MAYLSLVSSSFRRWTYASIYITLVIAMYSIYIEVMMYTFILYINAWTPIYLYQLRLLLYSFNLVYTLYNLTPKHQFSLWGSILTSYKVVSVLHNLVIRLLQSCWFYTTLSQACYNLVQCRQPCGNLDFSIWEGSCSFYLGACPLLIQ